MLWFLTTQFIIFRKELPLSTESFFDTQAANDKKQRYHKSESETWSATAVTNEPRDHTDESYEQRPMTGVSDIEAQYDQHGHRYSRGTHRRS